MRYLGTILQYVNSANDIFYFGEDVDDYENGEIVSHGGAWLAGANGSKAGMIMPGKVEVVSKLPIKKLHKE